MQAELIQTLVNAVLLIGVTLIAGSIGLKRFEAIDRRLESLEVRMDDRFGGVDDRFGGVHDRFASLEVRMDDRFGGVHDRFASLEARMGDRFDALRRELKHDLAVVDGHVGEVRAELAQTRSDLTYVALAVGAHRSEGSG